MKVTENINIYNTAFIDSKLHHGFITNLSLHVYQFFKKFFLFCVYRFRNQETTMVCNSNSDSAVHGMALYLHVITFRTRHNQAKCIVAMAVCVCLCVSVSLAKHS